MENNNGMKKIFTVYPFDTVKHAARDHGIVLPGNDIFIGKDEKRRNKEVLHIEMQYTFGNYALFYRGSNDILKNALVAMEYLLNHENDITEKKRASLYKVLIESLHIVHHISTVKRHSKLNGINSLSTCCLDNLYCLERMKNNDSICRHCYSATQQKTQLALQDRCIINGIILKNIVIPAKYWKKYVNPADMSKYFRIESFGDVQNKNQALNYIELVKAFPRVHFAAWTKNTGIWYFAFMQSEKPINLSFVVSSNQVNKPELYHAKNNSFVDHVFTVYDKAYIAENNVAINCGGRACMECIKRGKNCYFRNTDMEIKEELK